MALRLEDHARIGACQSRRPERSRRVGGLLPPPIGRARLLRRPARDGQSSARKLNHASEPAEDRRELDDRH
jgi:hypothetical protein